MFNILATAGEKIIMQKSLIFLKIRGIPDNIFKESEKILSVVVKGLSNGILNAIFSRKITGIS